MRPVGKVLTLLATLLLLAFPFVVWWKAQALVDWWALRGYQPSQRVVALADATTMTPYGRHIFYVNKPELVADVGLFRQQCPDNEQTIVLGCYHSRQGGIDIYDVKDPRLDGIHEVTAAHEMLHAAYERLNGSVKSKLNVLLRDYYNNRLNDDRIKNTLGSYKDLNYDDLTNEMHSIFGTEATDLPSELESHYRKYFNSRAVVAELAQNYASEFTSRTNAIKDYDNKLEALKIDIESTSNRLKEQRERIIGDRNRLDSYRASGDIDRYNSEVAAFNSQVDSYNRSVERLRRSISEYNRLLDERNELAKELQSLDESIDTRLIPQRL